MLTRSYFGTSKLEKPENRKIPLKIATAKQWISESNLDGEGDFVTYQLLSVILKIEGRKTKRAGYCLHQQTLKNANPGKQ